MADCLCCMAKLCASGFRAHEGTALCFRILAGRAHAGSGAMKAVGEYLRGRKEAEEIVDNGGIKTLGRIFMGRGKPKMVTGLKEGKKLKREKRNWERGIEEKVVERAEQKLQMDAAVIQSGRSAAMDRTAQPPRERGCLCGGLTPSHPPRRLAEKQKALDARRVRQTERLWSPRYAAHACGNIFKVS